MQLFDGFSSVNTVRTLSETKRSFYTQHRRPIDSLYRRVVEELMVEMHLLSVNSDFRYDPFYALGIITAYDRFMAGYNPENDRESIFQAICAAVEGDAAKLRQDADSLLTAVGPLSAETAVAWLSSGDKPAEVPDELHQHVKAIAASERFKYSRLFAIGLYATLERVDPTLVSEEEKRDETLEAIATALKLPAEKLSKDLQLFRENMEKIKMARQVLEDTIAASRKQRERREAEKAEKAAAEEAKQAEETAAAEAEGEPEETASEAPSGEEGDAPAASEEQK